MSNFTPVEPTGVISFNFTERSNFTQINNATRIFKPYYKGGLKNVKHFLKDVE